MVKNISKRFALLKRQLTKDADRVKVQFTFVYVIFTIVSGIMSILNVLDGWHYLMLLTVGFSACNIVNFILAIISNKTEKIARVLFYFESLVLFTGFIFFGEPEGFSAIWIALFPVAGMLLFRRKLGSVLATLNFLIIAFSFWTPWGKALLPDVAGYTDSFLSRFPLLYLAFFAIGYFFEFIREHTQNELNKQREKYIQLSYTDKLTGLGSSTAYFEHINEIDERLLFGPYQYRVISIDLNKLKETNDLYGHRFGNELIIRCAEAIKDTFKTSKSYRVGGDEFSIIVQGEDLESIDELFNDFSKKFEFESFNFENVTLGLSLACGYSVSNDKDTRFNDVFQRADALMYENKHEVKLSHHIKER